MSKIILYATVCFSLLSLPISTFANATTGKERTVALVYKGIGGCRSCAEAAARAVRRFDLEIKYVSASEVTEEIFEDALLWVQPAGNAISAANALGTERLAMIRKFVKNGGRYVGFCAGAFLADTNVDDDGKVKGLGLLPFASADYEVNDKDNIDMVWINWGKERRHIFFNGGATFLIPELLLNKNEVQVLATYEETDKPATVHVTFGRGQVVVSGAHPEAPQKWKFDNDLEDEDDSDLDLAQDMVKRAIR